MPTSLGIDLGATHVKFVHLDDHGACLAQGAFDTLDSLGPNWIPHIRQRLHELLAAHPADHVGLCAPGLAARDGRSIAWMQGRLAQTQGLDWANLLRSSKPIRVLNDAHAALLGETWLGAARTTSTIRNAVLLTLGPGVGGAILCDGHLLRGNLGRAGHLGHLTVNADGPPDIVRTPGSLEDAIGDCTVAARSAGRFTTTKTLVAAHLAGDPAATAVWLRSIHHLAAALASIINAVDPEVIILGGGIAAAGDALFAPLRRQLDQWEWRPTGTAVKIIPAELGERAGAIGAAYAAMQKITA